MEKVAVLQLGPPLRGVMDWRRFREGYQGDQRLNSGWTVFEIEHTLKEGKLYTDALQKIIPVLRLGMQILGLWGGWTGVTLQRWFFEKAWMWPVLAQWLGHRSAGCLQLLFILHPSSSTQGSHKYKSLHSSPFWSGQFLRYFKIQVLNLWRHDFFLVRKVSHLSSWALN